MEPVRLSMVCMHSDTDDVEGNLERMAGFVEAARRQRTDLICFPETSLSGYTTDPSRIAPLSEEGPMVTKVLDLSAESGVDICFGYVGEGPCIGQSIASGGRIAGTYRKTHLGGREAPVYAAGSEFPVIDLGYAKLGIQLCWESHVTRITEIYARQGADVVLMPHASGLGPGRRRDAWDRILPARAYDNTVFVAACNLYGDCGGVRFGGGISVRDCRGNLLAEEYGGEKMVTVDLDPEDLERIRSGRSSTMADLYFLDKYRLDILRALISNVYAYARACARMEDLVGRAKELAYLSNVYDKAPVSCAVCGRRHLGKTAVIREFCRDKNCIYVSGMIGLSSDNLREIAKELTSFAGSRVDLEDVADFFPWLKRVCGKKKVVVVIDNYSDLVDNFPEFTSYMRQFINRDLPSTRMMLIVCDNDSSVFGRFYYTLDVRAMSYKDCVGFHPDYTPLQHLIAYSVVGGTPAYQHLFQGDPGEAIRTHFFGHMAVFLLEIESMLGSEPIARLNSTKVLAAIASGAETLNDIAERAELRSSVARDAIEDMENKGMVRREVSPSKRTVFAIHSNILRFYFTIVARYQPRVAFMSGNDAYEMARADIDRYLESMFENVCIDYVNLKYRCDGFGKPRKKDNSPDDVINFVAVVDENRVKRTMMATCRMYGDKFGKGDLEDLKERSKAVKGSNRLYVMFSAAGFSVDLKDIASKDPNVRLVSLEDIYA